VKKGWISIGIGVSTAGITLASSMVSLINGNSCNGICGSCGMGCISSIVGLTTAGLVSLAGQLSKE